ncbi:hypothetical protein VVD37_15670 [Bacteroides fragilis]|uniref:hypothetical protein n=2 Tax=Bacteroides fragilis TaxID=817 RepID=UPI00082898D5|nr:hypothetical protein [Bacteroides fragilis]OCR39081.1 hypothetical protein AC239_30880 [Bacteroides fragilis]USA59727.1 hypothetical protein NC657_10660 [Bacteroides fragilis]
MSLTANIYPSTIALAGNPIKLTINSSSVVSYTIRQADRTIFSGSGEGEFSVFLQDIFSGILSPKHLLNESTDILLLDSTSATDIAISVQNTQGETKTLSLKAVIGGISKRLLRRLLDENSNIFTWKLLNSLVNFFKTTRTNGRIITIRETELLPIPFLYPDGALKVVAAGIETSLSGTAGQPVALNLYRLRKKLFQTNQKLASVFDIYSGSTKSCTIVITPGTVSRERYLLEFLNSYGAYERIEVTGIGNIESEIESDSTYQIYDESIDDYIETRERQSARDKLQVESGYRNTEELVHLMDMLASDDIKILGLSGRNIRVNAVADNLTHAIRSTVPESIKMTLHFVDSDVRYTGSLSEDEIGNPRIHTEQFTPQFN